MSVKNLVKSMLTLSLLVISSGAFAQDQAQRMTPEQRAQNQLTWMQQNLSLSADQGSKVNTILISYAQQADKLRSQPTGPDRKSQMQQMRQNEENDLKAALTPDQFQKLSQHQQEMKAKMQQSGGGGMQQGGN